MIQQLTFSTERKYMATLVRSAALGKNILYVKGAPEIVMTFCHEGGEFCSTISQTDFEGKLLQYQQQA
ncbi:hypothetical protein NL453_29360, partial [Klebsiella pneumoniae]|nr:hypothetical protein [Klebsiella pneumoniae]